MASTSQIVRVQRVQTLLLKLHAFITTEGENRWRGSVSHILAVLGEAEENPTLAAERFAEARSFYRSLSVAKGGFSDFHVRRDDVNEQLKQNQVLEALKEAIWNEFESHA